MLSQSTRERLKAMGVFPIGRPVGAHKGDYNPIFTIDPESMDPSEQELGILCAWVHRYRSERYTPEEIMDRFWGRIANTVILRKRERGWQFQRATWHNAHEWAPREPCALPELFAAIAL